MIIERARRREPLATPAAEPASRNIGRERSLVSAADRLRLLRHQAATVWLTGLSGAGKSTLARALEKRLVDAGCLACVLDGDNVRRGLNRDLGFTAGERAENIRRVAEVARLMNEAGLIVISAFISPYREDRRAARAAIGPEQFVEVFVNAPASVCEQRDPKGLYAKARQGGIEGFTGVSAPYEEPEQPDLALPTHALGVEECVGRIVETLRKRGIIPGAD
jgi:adenylylsulfate kinase